MMVGTLEKHMFVSVDPPSNSMTLGVDWPNAKDAYDIVSTMYATFIASRYASEVSMFADQLRVLNMKKDLAASDVDAALTELTKLEQAREKELEAASETTVAAIDGGAPAAFRGSMSGARPARPSALASSPDLDVARTLGEVRSKVKNVETEQNRRATEADAQLADARAALGPLHPTVVALTRKAEAAREISPELASLRVQEKQLVQRLADSAATAPNPAPASPAWTPLPAGGPAQAPQTSPDLRMATDLHNILTNHEDAPTTLARAKLAAASQQYNDLLGRTQASSVELDVARSSFKEEYSVVRPPEIPTRPRKPNIVLIVIGGLVGALLLFFAVPGARDLLGGVLIEPWQIETRLKLPVLGELSSEGVGALGPHSDKAHHP
jgi:Sec-independent protein translocase protein TatA